MVDIGRKNKNCKKMVSYHINTNFCEISTFLIFFYGKIGDKLLFFMRSYSRCHKHDCVFLYHYSLFIEAVISILIFSYIHN